jgi:hypothetical protein
LLQVARKVARIPQNFQLAHLVLTSSQLPLALALAHSSAGLIASPATSQNWTQKKPYDEWVIFLLLYYYLFIYFYFYFYFFFVLLNMVDMVSNSLPYIGKLCLFFMSMFIIIPWLIEPTPTIGSMIKIYF